MELKDVLQQYNKNGLQKGPSLLFRHSNPTKLYTVMADNMESRDTSLQLGGPDIVATLAAGARQGEVIGQFEEEIIKALDALNINFSSPQKEDGSVHIDYVLGEEKKLVLSQEPLSEDYDAMIQGPERQGAVDELVQEYISRLKEKGLFLHPGRKTIELNNSEEIATGRLYIPERETLTPYSLERKISE